VNAALALPAGTVTKAGTLTAGELPCNDIATPPVGAAPVSVTEPWELIPPRTLAGLTENEFKAGGVTVSSAVFFTPL
jgi:hypothetical protein